MPGPLGEAQQYLKTCHGLVPGIRNAYGYKPTLAAGVVFCLLFCLSTLGHGVRSIQYRKWSSPILCLGAVSELLGWAARIWSSKCPYKKTAFLIQISTLVIAPVFFAAAIYLMLGRLIQRHGAQYSILKPQIYLWIVYTCDIISLLIQASGAGIATNDYNKPGHHSTKSGTYTVVGGIGFQILSMTFFVVCMSFFIRRTRGLKLPRPDKLVLGAMAFSLFFLYVRNIFRCIELAQGFTGYLSSHEGYFIGLDGVPMVLAVGVFNVFDPSVLLRAGGPTVNTDMDGHVMVGTEQQNGGKDSGT